MAMPRPLDEGQLFANLFVQPPATTVEESISRFFLQAHGLLTLEQIRFCRQHLPFRGDLFHLQPIDVEGLATFFDRHESLDSFARLWIDSMSVLEDLLRLIRVGLGEEHPLLQSTEAEAEDLGLAAGGQTARAQTAAAHRHLDESDERKQDRLLAEDFARRLHVHEVEQSGSGLTHVVDSEQIDHNGESEIWNRADRADDRYRFEQQEL